MFLKYVNLSIYTKKYGVIWSILSEYFNFFYSFRHRCLFIRFSDILNHFYKRNFRSFLLFHKDFLCYQFFQLWIFFWILTQTLFRTCVNAGDRLWIISGHNHGGYQLPAMDMDMLQLPMEDMLLSATDMTLFNTDMDRHLPECSP